MKTFTIKPLMKCYKTLNGFSSHIMLLQLLKVLMDSAAPFIGIYMAAQIVDDIVNGKEPRQILIYAVCTVTVCFLVKMISVAVSRVHNIKYEKLLFQYRKSKSIKVAELDYSEAERSETRQLLNQIQQYEDLNNGGLISVYDYTYVLLNGIFDMLFSVCFIFPMFFSPYPQSVSRIAGIVVNPFTGIFIFVLMIGYVVYNAKMGVKCAKFGNEQYSGFTAVNDLSSELTSHIYNAKSAMDIRIFGQTDAIMKHYQDVVSMSYSINEKTNRYSLRKLTLPAEGIRLFTLFITYMFLAASSILGRFSVGAITKYIASLSRFSDSIKRVAESVESVRYNIELSKLYFDFMEKENGRKPGKEKCNNCNGAGDFTFEFRNVSFQYAGSDVYALKNINFILNARTKLAIVGMNGSGKTTIIKLLCRLYEPTEGEILLNGKKIQSYDYEEYLKLFSVVFQDYTLFSMPIACNIAANQDYVSDKVLSCVDQVGLTERITALKNGINTVVYQNFDKDGVMISGGEEQKIAIARALYRDAPLMIMDEPTASLDPISEADIYTHINEIIRDHTVVFISHRLSSCIFSDEIIVLREGEIVQKGTHRELLKQQKGTYYELWNAQAQYYV